MAKQLLKPVLIGILAGAALFVLPFFLLRTLLFFLFIGGLFRLLAGRRFGWGRWRRYGPDGGFTPALADTIRSMSEEEYQAFRQRYQRYANPPGGEGPQPANP